MKILHAIAQYPDRTGSGVYCRSLIKALDELIKPTQALVCGLNSDQIMPDILARSYPVYFKTPELGFPLPGMSDVMPYKSTVYSQMTKEQIAAWQDAFRRVLATAIAQEKPDLIICHHLWMLCSLCLEFHLPVLAIAHGTDIRQAEQHPEFFHRYVRNLDKVWQVAALSVPQFNELEKLYGLAAEQIFLGGGAYNHEIFYPPARKEKREEIKLVYVGKISDAKGSFELLEAFKRIPKSENLRLTLMGNAGDLWERYLAAREDDERIDLWMPASQTEMASFLRHKDIFVFPSYFEGLGLIAIEALASGLRLVVNDLPALASFLGEDIWQDESISVVDMPRLLNIDEIDPQVRESYIEQLKKAMLVQVQRCREAAYTPGKVVSGLEDFTWNALAKRILCQISKML